MHWGLGKLVTKQILDTETRVLLFIEFIANVGDDVGYDKLTNFYPYHDFPLNIIVSNQTGIPLPSLVGFATVLLHQICLIVYK